MVGYKYNIIWYTLELHLSTPKCMTHDTSVAAKQLTEHMKTLVLQHILEGKYIIDTSLQHPLQLRQSDMLYLLRVLLQVA